ncbi:MAG: MFS transporter [Cyclobacteriaceae bacterium]|nr:MFS transporter [Cyclobacteriaceae bacterium]
MHPIQQRLSKGFFALLSLPSTAMGFALSVQIAALSWILSTQYHLDIHEVGIVWAAGPLAGIVGQVVIGVISDKIWFWGGRRRPFIWIGGTMASLSLLALPYLGAISEATSLSLLAVALPVALLLDLSINISFNPTRSIIADVTPEGDKRTRGYTWMQTISGMFGVLAYAIGATYGNYTLIYFSVFLVFLFSIVPPFLIEEPRVLQASAATSASRSSSSYGDLYRIYAAHGFCWIGVQTMFVYMIFYVKNNMGITANEESGQIVSLSFLVLSTVGFILPAAVLEPLAIKFGRVKVHTAAMACMALGYLLIVLFGTTPFLVYTFMAIAGIGWAATVSLPFAIMTEKVDKAKMGLFMGIFNLSVVLPQLLVSLVLGSIIQSAENKSIIFIISAATLAISAILWTFVREETVTKPSAAGPSGGH